MHVQISKYGDAVLCIDTQGPRDFELIAKHGVMHVSLPEEALGRRVLGRDFHNAGDGAFPIIVCDVKFRSIDSVTELSADGNLPCWCDDYIHRRRIAAFSD